MVRTVGPLLRIVDQVRSESRVSKVGPPGEHGRDQGQARACQTRSGRYSARASIERAGVGGLEYQRRRRS